MRLDYMIYGRGLEQDKGFELQAAPPYVRQELLLYLSEFQELGDERLRSEIDPDILDKEPNPWADTYLFICQPPPCCCALLRITRAEGEEPGTWLREVRGKTVWSLEGWCAPYEQRENFFAMLPSILLWMEDDNRSLYNRSRLHTIEKQPELPGRFVMNPYSDSKLSGYPAEWETLCRYIRNAAQPFIFLYGPLADYYGSKIGRHYGVTHVFSAYDTRYPLPEPGADPLAAVEFASLRKAAAIQQTYYLRLRCLKAGKKEWHRRWEISERDKNAEESPAQFADPWKAEDVEQGIPMAELLAESELIRGFAERMGWETAPQTAPAKLRYQFSKEE